MAMDEITVLVITTYFWSLVGLPFISWWTYTWWPNYMTFVFASLVLGCWVDNMIVASEFMYSHAADEEDDWEDEEEVEGWIQMCLSITYFCMLVGGLIAAKLNEFLWTSDTFWTFLAFGFGVRMQLF